MAALSRRMRLVVALMVWAGAMVMLYAPMATWFEQLEQSRANNALADTVRTTAPEELSRMADEARAYNAALLSGVGADQYDYGTTLLVGQSDIMARLRIPSIDLDQPIRHGLSEDVLSRALGHVEGSSLPVGGPSTNAVIGGHRGLATATAFTYLNRLEVGDEIFVEAAGQVLTYRAISYEVLPPGMAENQPVQLDRDLLTLITCTPLGMNTDRIVVVAERVETPQEGALAGSYSELPRFPWWAVVMGVVTLAGIAFVVWPARRKRRGRHAAERGPLPSPARRAASTGGPHRAPGRRRAPAAALPRG